MEQEIEGPLKVLDANLIGQFGLFGAVEVVIHKADLYQLWGRRSKPASISSGELGGSSSLDRIR